MRIRFLFLDLVALVLVIPAVIAIFRIVDDRRLAATLAGILFVVVPGLLMLNRWKKPLGTRLSRNLWWVGVLQFWLLFALPILGARLVWWESPFESFTFFGFFPGPTWHHLANGSYTIMLFLIVVAGLVAVPRVKPASGANG